jgi:hypothetical protein
MNFYFNKMVGALKTPYAASKRNWEHMFAITGQNVSLTFTTNFRETKFFPQTYRGSDRKQNTTPPPTIHLAYLISRYVRLAARKTAEKPTAKSQKDPSANFQEGAGEMQC